ncbi:transposase [Faecalibacillus faecis]|uniref:transposase n=1 Tax=Faecalibacillus faecis TaxID=1982628 RepID=UPI001D069E3F|nr:transposase [Faecalibacillus faecis]
MKNIHITTADVAKRYNISDTAVHYIFLQYLDVKRLPLPEIVSVDEVFLDIDFKHRYALVIMDFNTLEIVDILPNRWEETTNAYFLSISLEERMNVKYLICDMYNPYINYTKRYFPNSIAVVDSFHIVAWLTRKIRYYINNVKKSSKLEIINYMKKPAEEITDLWILKIYLFQKRFIYLTTSNG